MQKEIQVHINKPHYPKIQSIQPGDLCLASLPHENDYHRALILKTDQEKALCFFVDFGDETVVSISDLKYIDDNMILKLPFQSIQCTLHGVKPTVDKWDESATDILYNYSVEPETDIFRSLFVKVEYKAKSNIMNQNRYSIILKDGFGERNVIINQLLIECGFASQDGDNIIDFKLPKINDYNEEDENLRRDRDELLDICRKTEEVDENFHPTGKIMLLQTYTVCNGEIMLLYYILLICL